MEGAAKIAWLDYGDAWCVRTEFNEWTRRIFERFEPAAHSDLRGRGVRGGRPADCGDQWSSADRPDGIHSVYFSLQHEWPSCGVGASRNDRQRTSVRDANHSRAPSRRSGLAGRIRVRAGAAVERQMARRLTTG